MLRDTQLLSGQPGMQILSGWLQSSCSLSTHDTASRHKLLFTTKALNGAHKMCYLYFLLLSQPLHCTIKHRCKKPHKVNAWLNELVLSWALSNHHPGQEQNFASQLHSPSICAMLVNVPSQRNHYQLLSNHILGFFRSFITYVCIPGCYIQHYPSVNLTCLLSVIFYGSFLYSFLLLTTSLGIWPADLLPTRLCWLYSHGAIHHAPLSSIFPVIGSWI